jgi:Tol biopolymer transport system component
MNLAPSLSPDGRRMVSLSERSMFAIEMYVSEVATGKVTRKLVKTAGDPHFESLQFIESSGDWSPDGKRFVFAALTEGKAVLSIVEVDSGRRVAEHAFPDLEQLFNPAWSPDGRYVAFTAMKGGVLDLFTFDLERQQRTRITDDPFADYDPEWAPNGRELAWVTDRFSSNLDVLQFGSYRIGLIDVSTKEARALAGFPYGRNSNPEFSPDGRQIFFIGTPDGVPNVYRMDLASGSVVALTNVVSGVSGITPLTPALSVAAAGDNMAFTVFENDAYNIYALEGVTQIPGRPVPSSDRNGALLAPSNRSAGSVYAYLGAPAQGLPPAQEATPEEYKPKLGLDLITQPTASVGVSRWGAYGAGSLALLWSDMLGNHQLATYFQVAGGFNELGAGATYVNKSHRWNWGLTGERMPYIFDQYIQTLGDWDGDGQPDSIAEGRLRYNQINQGISAMLQYPFDRAHRVEFTGGLRQIKFEQEFRADYFTPNGVYLGDRTIEIESDDSLNLGEVGSALVYDSAITGATSPILGQRYRFEYLQSAGTLQYSGILLDYRKYLMPVRPFTVALRGLHYGRYGRNSEDPRLGGVSVGYPGLVRGYDYLEYEDCPPVGDCPLLQRIYGSRMAVVNAELRFPLFGVFSGRSYYGPLPIEGIVFGDAGVAWTSFDEPRFAGGTLDPVRSFGTGIRFNLLGFLIGEIDFVKPFDRPQQGWVWQFNFIPGF